MTKRIYVVEVTTTAYVLADDQMDAERIARGQPWVDDCGAESDINVSGPIAQVLQVEEEWRDCLPYCWPRVNLEDKTIRQIIEANAP